MLVAKGEEVKSTIESSEGLKRKLKITVSPETVKSTFERQFLKIRNEVTLKGFRKGKAPLDHVKSLYRDQVTQNVVEQLVNTNYANAIKEHKLQPISFPKIDLDKIEDDQGFTFTAEFEVRPDVVLKNYIGLELEKEETQTDEKRLNTVLDQIRESKAERVPVLEDRPAQTGDFTDIDFEGFLSTGPLPNGAAKNFILELGSNSFIPGFEDGIIGMKVSEQKDIKLTFPETYHATEVAGAEVTFKVTLNKLLKKSLPEITDTFVEGLGDPSVKTVSDLKAQVQKDIERSEESRINQKLQEDTLKKLIKENPIEAPESLVAEQKESLKQNSEQTLRQQGLGDEEVKEYFSKWDNDFTQNATDIIKSSLIVDAIADKENLQPTDKDVEARIEEIVASSGMEAEKIREFYKQPNRFDSLKYRLLETKVVDFVISKAKVKTVPATKAE